MKEEDKYILDQWKEELEKEIYNLACGLDITVEEIRKKKARLHLLQEKEVGE